MTWHQDNDGKKRFVQAWLESEPLERKYARGYHDDLRSKILHIVGRDLHTTRIRPQVAVAAFVALSPLSSEQDNLTDLSSVCRNLTCGAQVYQVRALGPNVLKAEQLLRNQPEDVFTILSGVKVTHFYYNILEPKNNSYVCVDGHITNMFYGVTRPLRQVSRVTDLETYRKIAEAVRTAAFSLDIPAPCLAALCWIKQRRKSESLRGLAHYVSESQMSLFDV